MPPGLYEKDALRALTGGALRPGGLDLTRRGLELCAWKQGDLVLDVGCGPGESLGLMRGLGLMACGLDRSAALLREAARRGPAIQGEAERLPFADASLDGVSAECVLSSLPDQSAALKEMRRALKPGGRLLLSDIFFKEAEAVQPAGQGSSPFAGAATLPRLQALLEEAGFKPFCCLDESQSLAQLAVRMIFAYGSTAAFFQCWNPDRATPGGQIKNLGYALCVAEAVA